MLDLYGLNSVSLNSNAKREIVNVHVTITYRATEGKTPLILNFGTK